MFSSSSDCVRPNKAITNLGTPYSEKRLFRSFEQFLHHCRLLCMQNKIVKRRQNRTANPHSRCMCIFLTYLVSIPVHNVVGLTFLTPALNYGWCYTHDGPAYNHWSYMQDSNLRNPKPNLYPSLNPPNFNRNSRIRSLIGTNQTHHPRKSPLFTSKNI